MSEVVQESKTPEQRVFGNAFSLSSGPADNETQVQFFRERINTIRTARVGWLPRVLDADHGVVADLFKDGQLAATLVVDYDTDLSDVFGTGETTLCSQVPFDEAVVTAEQLLLP